MTSRYFVAEPITQPRVTLTGSEAHHLLHVMRAKPGEVLTLFDGSGDEFAARVEKLGRGEARLTIEGRETVDRELPAPLILAVTLPKGDRRKWLVEKAVELGVSRLIPLETARSVAQPGDKTVERLRRSVIEASKQSGRNRLMEIAPTETWTVLLDSAANVPIRLIAHPGSPGVEGDSTIFPAGKSGQSPPGSVLLAVGPEGGFSDEEVAESIERGWQPVSLGRRILRVETAALALAAVVSAELERHLK